MDLIEFPEQTLIIAKNQPQYRPMPAHVNADVPECVVTCCWQLTLRERLKLLFSGKLWHQVYTFNQPLQPQLLLTGKPQMLSPLEQFRSMKPISNPTQGPIE